MVNSLFTFEDRQGLDDMVVQYINCTLTTPFNGAWREGDKIPFIVIDFETGKCQFIGNDGTISREFQLELRVK